MERITSKLTGAFVLLLLFAAAVTTANSQEQPKKVSVIYGIDNDGTLKQYLHRVAGTGPGPAFQGPNSVGVGWSDYKSVFSSGGDVIYGIRPDGVLVWQAYRSVGRGDPNMSWVGPKDVGRGWGDFKQVFSGGGGIIYAMTQEGKLLWYKHNAYLDGRGVDSPGAWEGPKEVGSGWNYWKHVFPGGNGIVYAIAPDNRLKWYRHIEYAQGAKAWEGPKDVGGPGWGTYKEVFSSGDGILYAVTEDGKLLWYREHDYLHGIKAWDGPNEIATGWGDFLHVFVLLPVSSANAPSAEVSVGPGMAINEYGREVELDHSAVSLKKAAAQATSNEIRCRGGRDKLIFTAENSKVSSTGETIIIDLLTFEPSSQAAGANGQGLKPGQCSWADRPMNERFLIRFETPANAQLKQALHGTPLDTSPTAAERFPDAQTIPAYMNDPNHYWSFFGAKPVNNFFVAAGHKFWKPGLVIRSEDSIRLKNDSPYVFEKPVDINALAAKGEAIANQDPLAVELRTRQPQGPARRGFDIGMAAADGQTAPGPGKQRIHDSLSPEEQGGFDTAVAFSLERNRNADLAAKGAAIAAADPGVAEARTAEADVFYWLGFDIATGIFGDPALGALGNRATGPGSLKIRDSLSAAGQRGFNAAVKLHLSRNYKP